MKRLMLIVPALMLSAASADESSYPIQPGYWETTTRFTSLEAPGLPEDVLAEMQNNFVNNPTTDLRCITPAEAANPTAVPLDDNQGCEFSEQSFADGRIRVRAVCPGPDEQGQIELVWEGGYTYTTMAGTLTSEVTGTGQVLRMTGRIDSRRIGDCPETSDPEED